MAVVPLTVRMMFLLNQSTTSASWPCTIYGSRADEGGWVGSQLQTQVIIQIATLHTAENKLPTLNVWSVQ
jgi:hypothetical protein